MGEHYILDTGGKQMRELVLEAIKEHTTLTFSVHSLAEAIARQRGVAFNPERLSWAKLESKEVVQESLMIVVGTARLEGEEEAAEAILSLSNDNDIPSDLELLSPKEL